MRTAYGYIRVSSEDQADSGLGLEAQRQRIRAYCELKGLRLAEILEDPGISGARRSTRSTGIKLLSIARKSKPVIVVAKAWMERSVSASGSGTLTSKPSWRIRRPSTSWASPNLIGSRVPEGCA